MRKKRFTIGDIVEVDKEKRVVSRYVPLHDEFNNTKKVMQRYNHDSVHGTAYKEIVRGVITGLKRFIEGEYYPQSRGTFTDYWYGGTDHEPGGVVWEKTVECWCVRTGYLNKEIYFFEMDIKMIQSVDQIYFKDSDYRDKIPLLETGWNEKYKQQMSRESKGWPRDSKGRFSKG